MQMSPVSCILQDFSFLKVKLKIKAKLYRSAEWIYHQLKKLHTCKVVLEMKLIAFCKFVKCHFNFVSSDLRVRDRESERCSTNS